MLLPRVEGLGVTPLRIVSIVDAHPPFPHLRASFVLCHLVGCRAISGGMTFHQGIKVLKMKYNMDLAFQL